MHDFKRHCLVVVSRQVISQEEQPQSIINSTVSAWLHGLQLDAYTELFHTAGYTMVYDLADVTGADLEQIGITSTTHRQLLLNSINNIRQATNSQSSTV